MGGSLTFVFIRRVAKGALAPCPPNSCAIAKGWARRFAPLPTLRSALALHHLEYSAGHGDAALACGDLRGHENQAAGRAHHARPRQQSLADFRGIYELRVELHRGEAG